MRVRRWPVSTQPPWTTSGRSTRASSHYPFRVKAVAPVSRRWADRTDDTTSGFRRRLVSNDGRDAPWPRVPPTEGIERKGDRRQFIAHIRTGFAARRLQPTSSESRSHRASIDGETRTRTGDTTIFRQSLQTLELGDKPPKTRSAGTGLARRIPADSILSLSIRAMTAVSSPFRTAAFVSQNAGPRLGRFALSCLVHCKHLGLRPATHSLPRAREATDGVWLATHGSRRMRIGWRAGTLPWPSTAALAGTVL